MPDETRDAAAVDAGAGRRKRWLFRLVKVAVILLLFYMLAGHIRTLAGEWSSQGEEIRKLRLAWFWFGPAAIAYLGGQVLFALFWQKLLVRLGVHVPFIKVLRAYSAGTLGKYIPGKAGVVVFRASMIPSGRIGPFWIGLSVVYETVTSMAAGGLTAFLCLLYVQPGRWMVWGGAAAIAVMLACGLHPLFFRRLAKVAALPFRTDGGKFDPKLWHAILLPWGVLQLGGWLLLGVSFWATVQAMGLEVSPVGLVALTGAAALATSAGFLVIFVPSGLAVRELIIIHVLGPVFGEAPMVLASLLLRTLWTVTEVGLAGVMYFTGMVPQRGKPQASESTRS